MALAAVAALTVATANARIFTSVRDGRTVDGEIVGATGEIVRLQTGARQVEIPLDALVEPDRRFIALWKKEQEKSKVPNIKVSINNGLNRRRDPSILSWIHYEANFDFEIRIENLERDFDIDGATGVLIVIGRNCVKNSNDYTVMQRATMPVDVKAKELFRWKGPEVQFAYAEDRIYQTGYKYHSYIFQIVNAAGKTIYRKVMAPRFNAEAGRILEYPERAKFDPQGRRIEGESSFWPVAP